MMISRRNLLRSLLAAPAIVAADRLMAMPRGVGLIIPNQIVVPSKSWSVEFGWDGQVLNTHGPVPKGFVQDAQLPWGKFTETPMIDGDKVTIVHPDQYPDNMAIIDHTIPRHETVSRVWIMRGLPVE